MAPKLTPGISGQVLNDIPAEWSATWFREFALHYLQYADIRNANSGTGIQITGNIGTPAATVALTQDVQDLFTEPYLLAESPPNAYLTAYRILVPESGVLTVADGGALGHLTVGVAANGIGNAQIRQGVALSVIGNATGALTNVADISAGADNTVLQRSGGTLNFAAVALAALAAQAPATIVGNNAVGSAVPTALTAAQTKTLLAIAYTDVSGLATVAHSGAYGDLTGTPSIPAGANPSASVGLSVVDGSSSDFMRADGAPALDVTIAPTWTGAHTFSGGSGTPVALTATAGGLTLSLNDSSTTTGDTARLTITAGSESVALFCANQNQAAALVTGGPATPQACLRTLGAIPLVFGTDNTYRGQIDSSGNWVISGGSFGPSSSTTVGFYGKTPIAQRATTTNQHTSLLGTMTTTTGSLFDGANLSSLNQAVRALQEVMNTLAAYGLWGTS